MPRHVRLAAVVLVQLLVRQVVALDEKFEAVQGLGGIAVVDALKLENPTILERARALDDVLGLAILAVEHGVRLEAPLGIIGVQAHGDFALQALCAANTSDPQQLELLRVVVHVLLCHAVNRSLSVIDGRP